MATCTRVIYDNAPRYFGDADPCDDTSEGYGVVRESDLTPDERAERRAAHQQEWLEKLKITDPATKRIVKNFLAKPDGPLMRSAPRTTSAATRRLKKAVGPSFATMTEAQFEAFGRSTIDEIVARFESSGLITQNDIDTMRGLLTESLRRNPLVDARKFENLIEQLKLRVVQTREDDDAAPLVPDAPDYGEDDSGDEQVFLSPTPERLPANTKPAGPDYSDIMAAARELLDQGADREWTYVEMLDRLNQINDNPVIRVLAADLVNQMSVRVRQRTAEALEELEELSKRLGITAAEVTAYGTELDDRWPSVRDAVANEFTELVTRLKTLEAARPARPAEQFAAKEGAKVANAKPEIRKLARQKVKERAAEKAAEKAAAAPASAAKAPAAPKSAPAANAKAPRAKVKDYRIEALKNAYKAGEFKGIGLGGLTDQIRFNEKLEELNNLKGTTDVEKRALWKEYAKLLGVFE